IKAPRWRLGCLRHLFGACAGGCHAHPRRLKSRLHTATFAGGACPAHAGSSSFLINKSCHSPA
ncbi:MAG: hypothetical protein WA098_05905, partial [Smithella sp.]